MLNDSLTEPVWGRGIQILRASCLLCSLAVCFLTLPASLMSRGFKTVLCRGLER